MREDEGHREATKLLFLVNKTQRHPNGILFWESRTSSRKMDLITSIVIVIRQQHTKDSYKRKRPAPSNTFAMGNVHQMR